MAKLFKKIMAGLYSRISIVENENGEESVSITNQKKFMKEYAEKNNIEIYDYYIDDGYSGGNYDRPGFKRLINDIECGLINCVITKDTSRLGRDFLETGNYIYKYFPEKNVRYIAILDNFDTENPSGADDIIPFKTVVNDMYLKDTSRKIKSIRHGLMDQGLFVGSSVPYGYKRSEEDNRKFVIDDYAANIVQRIFKMALDDESDGMIARTLSDEGILPPDVYKGKKLKKTTFTTNLWKASSVKTILTNEVYIGTMIQGKYERVSLKSKKKRKLPRSKWKIKKNNHEPIIEKKVFESVNKKPISEIENNTRNGKYDYLLKGFVVCADCEKTMLARRVKVKSKNASDEVRTIYCCRTYATYRNNICSMHYYREEELNNKVLKEIRGIFLEYSKNETLSKKYESTLSNSNVLEKYQTELNSSQKKLSDIDKAISELYKDKVTGIITSDEFVIIKENFEIERETLIKKIEDLKIMLNNSKTNITDEKTKMKMINNFLKVKNPNKQMMKELIKKITIDKNKKVKIYLTFSVNGVAV